MPGHQIAGLFRIKPSTVVTKYRTSVEPGRDQPVEQPAGPCPVRRCPHEIILTGEKILRHLKTRQVTQQAAMGQHGTLGWASRPRGIDHDRRIVGQRPGGFKALCRAVK